MAFLENKRVKCTEPELWADDNMGICLACGEEADGVEPDAHEYTCDACGAKKVYGLAECAIMGIIDIVDESEETE